MPLSVTVPFLITVFAVGAFAQVSVLTYRYDNFRTGANLNETVLTASSVASGFGKLFARQVDGELYAQPLYVSNVTIPGKGIHNVVYVATMNDVVYAFDADSNAADNAGPLWTVSFANPATGITPIPITDIAEAANIRGNVGVESTAIIDLPSKTLYLVARTKESGAYYQRIHALSIETGAERTNSPVAISGSVAGNGAGSVAGRLTFDPLLGNQRPALAILKNQLLIAWASHEDFGSYHGWVMSYDITSLKQTGIVCTTPTGEQGGIWSSGWAPAIDNSNFAYFSVGNGTWDGRKNFGESVIKMSLSERLAIVDFFTPYNWAALNGNDIDLGSTGVMLIPGTKLAVTAGKSGVVYLVNTAKLGWEASVDAQIVQSVDIRTLNPYAYSAKGGPVYWNRPSSTKMIYIQNEVDPVHGFPMIPDGGGIGLPTLDTVNAQSSEAYSPHFGGGVLSLSGDPDGQGAIVWSSTCVDNQSGGHTYCSGVLRALDATNGLSQIWSSEMNSGRDAMGNWAKFVPPVVANGKLYMASFSNQLVVYGLLP